METGVSHLKRKECFGLFLFLFCFYCVFDYFLIVFWIEGKTTYC